MWSHGLVSGGARRALKLERKLARYAKAEDRDT